MRRLGDRRGCLGDPLYYFRETGSTNDVAAGYAERGARQGTTVVAAAQTSGRGRLGRSWYSPPGAGLYVSIVICSIAATPFLTLAGGVAVADGIRAATGLPLEIKWPNDVVTPGSSGRAAAQDRGHPRRGILVGRRRPVRHPRHRHQHQPGGLSAGTRGPRLVDRIELGRAVDSAAVLAEVLAAFTELDSSSAAIAPLLTRWRALAPSAVGTTVECDTPRGRATGVAAGIADDGALLVRSGIRWSE